MTNYLKFLLNCRAEAQKSPLLRRAVSQRFGRTEKLLNCNSKNNFNILPPAPRFFQISRQEYILDFNIFLLNFTVSGRKLKNPRYCSERLHYVVPEQQKNC